MTCYALAASQEWGWLMQDSTPWRQAQGRSLAGRRCRDAPLSAGCADPVRPAEALAASAAADRGSLLCALKQQWVIKHCEAPAGRKEQRMHGVDTMIHALQKHEKVRSPDGPLLGPGMPKQRRLWRAGRSQIWRQRLQRHARQSWRSRQWGWLAWQ